MLWPEATRADLLATRDLEGRTAVHIAAELGHTNVINKLALYGADLSAADSEGDTRLHGAAAAGHTTVIELLLQLEVQVDQPNLLQQNITPLHLACSAGNEQAVCVLLEHGASVAARGFGGATAVHAAAAGGSRAALELLLQPQHNADADALDDYPQTPLLAAIAAGPWNAQVVEALLQAGADIHWAAPNSPDALGLAAYHLSSDVIACIMECRKEELTAQMLARAAVTATEADHDGHHDDQDNVERVQQLEVVAQLLGAAMQKDPVAATAALFEALDGADDYSYKIIVRASLNAWVQAASRVADLESQHVAVQDWIVIVVHEHLRLDAREQQIQARMQLIAQREQQLAAREQQLAVQQQLLLQQQQQQQQQ
jgi:ankyrin repeat protein